MIKDDDLKEAIAECEGAKDPNANTCIKLAAYYTILNQRNGKKTETVEKDYSYAYYEGSEIGRIITTKGVDKCLPVLEELFETLQVLNPRLYQGVIRKLKEL